MSIMGSVVGFGGPQADWSQSDAAKQNYIKNKPDLAALEQNLEEVQKTAQGALPRSGGQMSGPIDMGGGIITGLGAPEGDSDGVRLGFIRGVRAELPRAGWSSGAPFFQTVNVPGMTPDWIPGAATLEPGDSQAADQAAAMAWGCVSRVESGAGFLTFTCYEERPQGDCVVRIARMVL